MTADRRFPDPRSSMGAFIAHEVRIFRENQNLTGTELGEIINVVRATVSKIESGKLRLKEDQARALDKYGNTGGRFELLVHFASLEISDDWFEEHLGHEARASKLEIWEPLFI